VVAVFALLLGGLAPAAEGEDEKAPPQAQVSSEALDGAGSGTPDAASSDQRGPSASGPGLRGLPGLARALSALPSAERLALAGAGELFLGSDFIYAGSSTASFGGALSGTYAVADFLDVFLAVDAARARNSLAVPREIDRGTGVAVGARLRARAGPMHLGVLAEGLWSAPVAAPAAAGTGLGFAVTALLSADLRSSAHVPLAVHLNAGYRSDAGATLSHARFGAWPTYAAGLWRWDVLSATASLELLLRRVSPFLEYHLELPVGPLAPTGFMTTRFTPGVSLPLAAGLRIVAAVDVGVPEGVRDGIPATPWWQGHLSVSWSPLGITRWSAAASGSTARRVAAPQGDRDRDGVPDALDACPDDGAPAHDGHGCALVDSDGDGLFDGDDACPQARGAAAAGGCPDTDGDGLIDRVDACPNVSGLQDDAGCPRYKQVTVTSTKIELSQKIFFAFGKDTIMPRSFELLDEVVQALSDRGSICVRIEGHTDGVGGAQQNLRLSQERTSAVRGYLVSQGVSLRRLEAVGYGATLPLESNATSEGRERNRRVEFVIVRCEAEPN
jgi:outer membrane protein OmpA-like peptidoglycan-associated protein